MKSKTDKREFQIIVDGWQGPKRNHLHNLLREVEELFEDDDADKIEILRVREGEEKQNPKIDDAKENAFRVTLDSNRYLTCECYGIPATLETVKSALSVKRTQNIEIARLKEDKSDDDEEVIPDEDLAMDAGGKAKDQEELDAWDEIAKSPKSKSAPTIEKPQLEVGAYKPRDEETPVLMVMAQGQCVGFPMRRGELGYDLLLAACNGAPKWLFGQIPMEL